MSIDPAIIGAPRPSAEDGIARARRVLLRGNALPARWQGRDRFVVLETGFGHGDGFLATWSAWRADPQRCRQLDFISIEACPPSQAQLQWARRVDQEPALAAELAAAWPALTVNLHRMVFDGGRVQLLLLPTEPQAGLPELVANVDAFCLDDWASQPQPGPWQPRVYKAMARIAAPGATLVSGATPPGLCEGLKSAGFEALPSDASLPAGGPTRARYAPKFVAKRPPARQTAARAGPSDARRTVMVIGAGLAGCASSAALCGHGWRVMLIDRQAAPAGAASGNPAGLFHGVVHAGDGHHARFHRACAIETTRLLRQSATGRGPDPQDHSAASARATWPASLGEAHGLLKLEAGQDLPAMQHLLQRLALPAAFVEALDPAEASSRAGIELSMPAWFYPGGGWLRPAALAQHWLAEAGTACRFIGGQAVAALLHCNGEWSALGADGQIIASASQVVLANAGDAARLLECGSAAAVDWPFAAVRGQLSVLPDAASHGLLLPRLPVTGAGYLLPAIDGQAIFGATAQIDDADPAVRLADHRVNLERLAQLSPALGAARTVSIEAMQGRTAWRCVSRDRLPLIGAVPAPWFGGVQGDWDQPRFVPRAPGLFIFNALGSRGISSAALGAQVLAALVSGAPVPLEAALLDAVDPARFLARASRRRAAQGNTALATRQTPAPR